MEDAEYHALQYHLSDRRYPCQETMADDGDDAQCSSALEQRGFTSSAYAGSAFLPSPGYSGLSLAAAAPAEGGLSGVFSFVNRDRTTPALPRPGARRHIATGDLDEHPEATAHRPWRSALISHPHNATYLSLGRPMEPVSGNSDAQFAKESKALAVKHSKKVREAQKLAQLKAQLAAGTYEVDRATFYRPLTKPMHPRRSIAAMPNDLGLLRMLGHGEFVGQPDRIAPQELARRLGRRSNSVLVPIKQAMRRYYTSSGQRFWHEQHVLEEAGKRSRRRECPFLNAGRRPFGPIPWPKGGIPWKVWEQMAALAEQDQAFVEGEEAPDPALYYDPERDGLEEPGSGDAQAAEGADDEEDGARAGDQFSHDDDDDDLEGIEQ